MFLFPIDGRRVRPAPPAETGVGGTERSVVRRLYGSAPLDSVQKNPVDPGQRASGVQHRVVSEVSLGDAQLLEREFDRPLFGGERP